MFTPVNETFCCCACPSSSPEASGSHESLLSRQTAENNSAELQKQDVLCFLLVCSNNRDKVFPQDSSFHPQSHTPHLSPRHQCILNKLKPDVTVHPSENHPHCDKKQETWSRVTVPPPSLSAASFSRRLLYASNTCT